MGLDLRTLKPVVEPVILRDGSEHRVAIFTGHLAQRYASIGQAATQAEQVSLMWEMAALLLPTATQEQILALDIAEVQAIIEYASQAVRAVMEAEPEKNGDGAEAGQPSAPMTPSAPSSSPSPGPPAGVSAP